jgi:hypothetical protein
MMNLLSMSTTMVSWQLAVVKGKRLKQHLSLLRVLSLTRSGYSDPIEIRWEGTPQEVILYHSYVIGFDPNFIEIRNSETVSV